MTLPLAGTLIGQWNLILSDLLLYKQRIGKQVIIKEKQVRVYVWSSINMIWKSIFLCGFSNCIYFLFIIWLMITYSRKYKMLLNSKKAGISGEGVCNTTFNNFSVISCGNLYWWRKPPTYRKSLANFII
jgi:hypothetical protein